VFEDKTFENILNEMLSRVPSNVDKREGSIIYDALAPVAYELAQAYYLLRNYVDLYFVDTAVSEYLDRKAADYGITRKPATSAIRKIETTGSIPIGSRWGLSGTTYRVNEMIATNVYSATCEQVGTIGNAYSGPLENIDNITDVTATLTDIIVSGSDEETDEELRERIREYLISPAQNGNMAQYLKWATEYPGIGAAKVFPLWNGGNTVKIAITNSQYLPAEPALVQEFQNYIDPNSEGLGNGVAPIGAKVTVTGGTPITINVEANVVLNEGYTEPEGAEEAISQYLASIVFKKNTVSYMKIGSALLDCPSIADLSNLKVNSGTGDIALTGDEIPVLGTLDLTVVST